METIKKDYNVLNQEAYCHHFLLDAEFKYNGKTYRVQSGYVNGGWGFEDTQVLDENEEYVYDEDIVAIGEEIIYNMDINKTTIIY